MPTLNPSTWREFSQAYLPAGQEKSPIQAKKLSQGMHQYLEAHSEIDLSRGAESTLKKFAFHKAGQKYEKKTFLTQEAASKVFQHYQDALTNLDAELNTGGEFVKPPKPEAPKWLTRLSAISTSVVEKYLDPKYKANIQTLFNQINTINQVVKPIFQNDPLLVPTKILTLELIAKQLAYYNPQNGEKFQIPHEGRTVEYQAEEIHLWMGMYAYGFRPVDANEDAPPILAFSGTRLVPSSRGSLATVTADLDPRGVGYIAYASGKKEITNWLKKVNGNALVTGHSLGGAISHYAAIDNPDLVQRAFTFSAPGISRTYGKKWKQLEKDPAHRSLIYNFNHSEDKVPTLGQSYVGVNYQAICAVEKTINQKMSEQRAIHKKRLFGRKVVLLCKTHPKKSLSVWMQRAISVIPFIVCLAFLCLGRILFGLHTSKPYASLFGPLRWSWRKLVTDKIAAKHFKQGAAAAA